MKNKQCIYKMLLSVVYFVSVAVYNIQSRTVLQELTANPEYSMILGWLSEETKHDLGGNSVLLTVFVPTNEAAQTFLKTHPIQAENIHWLGSIAEHCVVHGDLSLLQLKGRESLDTGKNLPKLWINRKNEYIYINNARITASIAASNGHVHEIDAVIYPIGFSSTLIEEIDFGEDYSGMKFLLSKAPETRDLLDDTTTQFTVFSPNPEAVADGIKSKNRTLLQQVIRRHVVRGQVVFSSMMIGQRTQLPTLENNGRIHVKFMDKAVFVGIGEHWCMVESFDVSTSNGVIHVINGVLGVSPGVNVYQALGLFDPSEFGETLNKVSNSAKLMIDLMDTTKMFTVFSPHNTAWDNISTTDIIIEVLYRHMLMEALTAADLVIKTEVITRSGEKLNVKNDNGKVYLEFENMKAEVTSRDKMASNGIIHTINRVMRTTTYSSACISSISMVALMICLFFNLFCKL